MDICPECENEDMAGGFCSHCFYDERLVCPRCNGTGEDGNNLNDPGPCQECDGIGKVQRP